MQGPTLAPAHETMVSKCAEELSRAMREEVYIDPQGREVRTKHAARVGDKGTQMTLWADIRTANRKHMEIAFKQRRHQIVGDCSRLKVDVDSYKPEPQSGCSDTVDFGFYRRRS